MSAINKPVFTHHRLEVYHLALRMAVLAKAVADSEPLHPARAAKRAEDRRTGEAAVRVLASFGSSYSRG